MTSTPPMSWLWQSWEEVSHLNIIYLTNKAVVKRLTEPKPTVQVKTSFQFKTVF